MGLTGEQVRNLFTTILDRDLLEAWARELGLVERQRKIEVFELVISTVIAASSAGGARTGDILRNYLERLPEPKISRQALYKRLNFEFELLMEKIAQRSLEYARGLTPDLPHPLNCVKDWFIVDSETVQLNMALKHEFRGTGDYAAIKVHKRLSVGTGTTVDYSLSPAREHDSKHLDIDESWRGYGLLCDLGYASFDRLKACENHGVMFVIRLKSDWKPRIKEIHRGTLTKDLDLQNDFKLALKEQSLRLDGKAIDATVEIGPKGAALEVRLVGVQTPKGYCFYLTNLPRRIGPAQISTIYRIRWEIELSNKLDKTDHRLDDICAQTKWGIKALIHASIVSSLITTILAHVHNASIPLEPEPEEPTPPVKRTARRAQPEPESRREGKSEDYKGKEPEKTRQKPPLHAALLAKMQSILASRIAQTLLEPEGPKTAETWQSIAEVLVHMGQDQSWRSRPSPLDQLRGYKKHSPKKKAKPNKIDTRGNRGGRSKKPVPGGKIA